MIELLVAVAILAFMAVVFLFMMPTQLQKGRDAERKADLEKIKVAFEDYYNDNSCYPPEGSLETCGDTNLAPYLSEIPCDPIRDVPYVYLPVEGDTCGGYRVLTALENETDKAISTVNCDDSCGCGYGEYYNYGVSAGVPVKNSTCEPIAIPESSPGPSGGGGGASPSPSGGGGGGDPVYVYACDSGGVCNQYQEGHPFLVNCPVTFETVAQCNLQCGANPSYRCN